MICHMHFGLSPQLASQKLDKFNRNALIGSQRCLEIVRQDVNAKDIRTRVQLKVLLMKITK
jgi:hypothetical protein